MVRIESGFVATELISVRHNMNVGFTDHSRCLHWHEKTTDLSAELLTQIVNLTFPEGGGFLILCAEQLNFIFRPTLQLN